MLPSVLLVLLTLIVCQIRGNRPIVETPLGKVQGHHKFSFNGRIFSAFEGVPYAKPPIGERRFEEPEAIEKWDGVWEATKLYECAQTHSKLLYNISEGLLVSGDEDCLYMNIYVPREQPDSTEKLDVIVHIHGGVFLIDSGHQYAHPEFLMDRDIIFVSFNFRHGILGFLSTDDDVVPGNNGLKDQVVALKWVQNNIASYGGNPSSVTLTGASSGGSCVQLHYLSQMSKGLFHRAWSSSGSALNFAITTTALAKAKKLARALGCPDGCTKMMVKCLKQRHYRHITENLSVLYEYWLYPVAIIGPVVEKGPRAFLSEDPYKLLAQGKVQDLPWVMLGLAQEGYGYIPIYNKGIQQLNDEWNAAATFQFHLDEKLPREKWNSTAKRIKDFYLGKDQKFSESNLEQLEKLFTDGLFTDGFVKGSRLQARATNASVYYCYFSYPGDHSIVAQHTHDNKYFYYQPYGENHTQNELRMKDVMIEFLVSFAKTGKPTALGIDWKPTGSDVLTYLNISSFKPEEINLQQAKELDPEEFWSSVFDSEN